MYQFYLFESESCKQQVNVNSIKAELDDRYKCLRNRSEVGHLVLHSQHLHEWWEIVFSENVTRSHAQCVNISSFIVDTKSVGAEGEDLATHCLRHLLRHVLTDAGLFDPGLHQVIQSTEREDYFKVETK